MPNPTFLNFAPDADLTVVKDYSRAGRSLTLQIETRVVIPDNSVAELERRLDAMRTNDNPGTRSAVYDFVYGFARNDLEKPGPAHTMLKAACGIVS